MKAVPEIESSGVASTLFGEYRSFPEVFDEMLDDSGRPRPHWEKLVHSIERLGGNELQTRVERARNIIRENGITYNVYADSQGMHRPWDLDIVPLIIPSGEWSQLETALIQRTHLFNRILADLYGQQRLLRDGLLPPAIVLGNPSFLRPCHGIPARKDIWLFLHAIDLARAPDGQWWVLADRTQAPSGVGYALENRIVLSRVLPDTFRECNVQRLARFFQIARDTLRSLSPGAGDHPNVILLTPGPYNETYFEQAYLARYLGFTLVEGNDLTVRDRRVFIKTLEGLQPVDVILRRVDDNFCDPLELRSDSMLGVPGLVEAVRSGNVVIANSLGSGLSESPALLPFLPNLCRHLLGEDLKCPSVATWWCGQAKERAFVLDHLEQIVIKRAFPPSRGEPWFGDRLTEQRRSALIADIESAPHAFVGQEHVGLSNAPVWADKSILPRSFVMRAYVVATSDGYAVMPGGLTRVSTAKRGPVVSMQRGGGSKDTWVISDGPASTFSLLRPAVKSIQAKPRAAEVPSRVADDLFWMGRYAERLEGALRVLRCSIRHLAGESSTEQATELSLLVHLLVRMELLPQQALQRTSLDDIERELLSLVYKANRPGAIRELVNRLRQIAAGVRDRLSADTWRIVMKLHSDALMRPHRNPVLDAYELINTLVVDLAAFSGLEMENMTRGHGWHFLDIGRRLERAIHIAGLIKAALEYDPQGDGALEALLEIADSMITYRRRYFDQAQLHGVLHLLLLDETNPRSLEFQLKALIQHSNNLPEDKPGGGRNPIALQISRLSQRLHGIDILELAESLEAGKPTELMGLLEMTASGLKGLSDALTHFYFSHTTPQLSETLL